MKALLNMGDDLKGDYFPLHGSRSGQVSLYVPLPGSTDWSCCVAQPEGVAIFPPWGGGAMTVPGLPLSACG